MNKSYINSFTLIEMQTLISILEVILVVVPALLIVAFVTLIVTWPYN